MYLAFSWLLTAVLNFSLRPPSRRKLWLWLAFSKVCTCSAFGPSISQVIYGSDLWKVWITVKMLTCGFYLVKVTSTIRLLRDHLQSVNAKCVIVQWGSEADTDCQAQFRAIDITDFAQTWPPWEVGLYANTLRNEAYCTLETLTWNTCSLGDPMTASRYLLFTDF